ncbi:hypothetical protein K525DRAFT_211201 [Schizophyllum commune Loenen D]|nr:hypothetical protein K525DRAFT_211201 [Schizophyllum commune Loenen D]
MPVDDNVNEVEAPSCPEAAPDWFRSIFDVMNHPELGEDYCELLRAWCDVEEEHEFDANKGVAMSVSGGPPKPAALTMWIQRGRRAKKLIIINDFDLFEMEMWDWWNGLQPDWREWDEEGFPRTDTEIGEDWGALAVHGQNGLASAVACLCWWGASLREGAPRESWERCVADVRWVAEHVTA